ncbi:MAG TPA: TonB-dependent receptor, partial [Acidobacteriota bacterium]|nr:TonB-dependent receptor [Acidobacteriota bacterium]
MRFRGVLVAGLSGLLFLMIGAGLVFGQGGSGTINATVYDQSGSVVPNAQITLTREGTGDIRRIQSNNDGFFSLVALPVGTYTIEIEYEGFSKWIQKSIALTANDKVSVSNIQLTPKSISQTVEVTATSEVAVPVSSIEKSAVIESKTIQNVSIIGRSAVEMLKILPGVVIPETDDYQVASFGAAGIGTAHVTGIRQDSVSMSVDGSNTLDIGSNSGSNVTPNVEMVQEVKVETAAMSAENARGPVSVSATSKSGTKDFHGEGYFYARHYNLNSQDWQANRYGFDKPKSKFFYPGFNIGGPVLIPGTGFNKNRDKLFFFAGFEWNRQDVDLGIDSNKTWVPTEKMRKGDFSELKGGAYPLSGYDTNSLPGTSINGTPFYDSNGVILNQSLMDPGGKAMMNMYPLPNKNPATNNGYNYISQLIVPQNRNQQLVRIDYSISDRTKLYTRFNHEGETQSWPYCLWWNNGNQVPSPTPVTGTLRSYSSATNLVSVLNPSTTNEVVFSTTYYNLPFDYADPTKMSRSSLGYPYKGMFKNTDVLPNITDWGGGVATMYQPGGFPRNAVKWTISADDNFSKVIGTHSLKFGFHHEFIENSEGTALADMGTLTPTNWGGYTTGNAYADLLVGYIGSYAETNQNFNVATRQLETSFYAQDSWKATRRLTLELGARFYHLGQQYNPEGLFAAFDPSKYDASAPLTKYTGVVAKYRGDNVSDSIWNTPALKVAPRIGFAFDLT